MKALILAAPLLFATSSVDRLQAGRWQETKVARSASLGGDQLPAATLAAMKESKFICIAPAEAANPKTYFSNGAEDCSAPVVTHAPGRVSITATCKGHQNALSAMEMSGEYGPSSFRFDIHVDATLDDKPFKMTGVLTGHHLGACDGTETK